MRVDRAVEPIRSENRTVTWRRRPRGAKIDKPILTRLGPHLLCWVLVADLLPLKCLHPDACIPMLAFGYFAKSGAVSVAFPGPAICSAICRPDGRGAEEPRRSHGRHFEAREHAPDDRLCETMFGHECFVALAPLRKRFAFVAGHNEIISPSGKSRKLRPALRVKIFPLHVHPKSAL